MLKVFKYQIEPNDYFELILPAGAEILDVAAQRDTVCLWALVDPDAPKQVRRFRWAGTGHPITENPKQLIHVSTFQMRGGELVFHIFEVLDCAGEFI